MRGVALQVGPTIESCINQPLICLDVFGHKVRTSQFDNSKFSRFISIRPSCRLISPSIWAVGETKKYRIHHSFGSKLKSRKCRILRSLRIVSLRSRKCRILGLLWARDPEIPPMEASLFWRPLISAKPQKSSNGDNSICFILHSALGPHKSAIHINFPSGLSVPDKAKYGEKSDKCFARIALSTQTPENMTKKHYSRHSNNWKRKSTLPKAKPTNDVLLPKLFWRN